MTAFDPYESRVGIRNTLQRIVDGEDGVYELDDCFSGSFSDPELEVIRRRLWELPDEFPPVTRGEFCGPGGVEVMRGWIKQLSDENDSPHTPASSLPTCDR